MVLLFQDIPLSAPVAMTMKASVASEEEQLPSCSFFNENTGSWESEGLILDSLTVLSNGGGGGISYDVSCMSFHLSDFTVTTTEIEPVFQPVTLVSKFRLNAPIPFLAFCYGRSYEIDDVQDVC